MEAINKQQFITGFLKVIEIRLNKELPDIGTEIHLMEKAYDVLRVGVAHIKEAHEKAH